MKKKIRNLLTVSIVFFCVVYFFYYLNFFSKNMIFGNNWNDWIYQHIQFPEYFRRMFYNEKVLLPQFSFNLGSGQNIFNIAYYGILNPLIIFSYFLPNIPMYSYIGWLGFFIVVFTGILIYIWLCRNGYSRLNSFISGLYSIFAVGLIVQSNANYMYLSYIPFLIVTFIGIDLYFEKSIKSLFILGSASCILVSYVFIPSYSIAIIIYCFYKYIHKFKKIHIQKFAKYSFRIATMYIVGILLTSIMLIPTITSTFLGRVHSGTENSIISFLMPKFQINTILYTGVGLTSITLFVILINIFNNRNKVIKMMSWFMLICMTFPIFRVFLNGFLYDDTKVLYPYILFIALIFAYTLDNIRNYTGKQVGSSLLASCIIIVWFSRKMNGLVLTDMVLLCVVIMVIYVCKNKLAKITPLMFVVLIFVNTSQMLETFGVTKNSIESDIGIKTLDPLIKDTLNKDKSFYRMNNCSNSEYTVNRIPDKDYFTTSFYSSLINENYKDFYSNVMNAPHNSLANTILETQNNTMLYTYMGDKYITLPNNVSEPIGYDKITEKDGVSVYKNNNVFPLGYSIGKTYSYDKFKTMDYPEKQQAVLEGVVTKESNNSNIKNDLKSLDILKDLKYKSKYINVKRENNTLDIKVSKQDKIEYKLNNEIKDKILFINFDIVGEIPKDDMLGITINGIKNSLSSPKYRYYNENRSFQYVISSNKPINKLEIVFDKGNYKIQNLRCNTLDYDIVKKSVNNIDKFNVDRKTISSKGLKGNINVKEDGWFVFTLPYDKGFTIKVDDYAVNYEEVNGGVMGFKIKKGYHNIQLSYVAPGFRTGQVVSTITLAAFIIIVIHDLYIVKKRR